jgi:hypothetical protein
MHQKLAYKVKSTVNVRTIYGGLRGFERKESFARLLTCYHQTVRAIGNINGQKLLIAANFEFLIDQFLVLKSASPLITFVSLSREVVELLAHTKMC